SNVHHADTSEFSGILAWTVGTVVEDGVRVWDLAQSKFIHKVDASGEETFSKPALSADGEVGAYFTYKPEEISSEVEVGILHLTRVELASGATTTMPYLSPDGTQFRTILSFSPVADGQSF